MNYQDHPHRRYNPLSDQWIKVSPHRTKRHWQGQREHARHPDTPSYDPGCYLCPGNSRAGNLKNPVYERTFAFDNDFAALLSSTPEGVSVSEGPAGLLQAKTERGRCRVICFSPRHDLTMARMSIEEISNVVTLWQQEYQLLGDEPYISHVQIFENRGDAMGASNPHPHGQIWADEFIPDIPLKELMQQSQYHEVHGSSMLSDYLAYELEEKTRIVYRNSTWAVVVPYWAVWPYEVLVLPMRPISRITDLSEQEHYGLAEALRILCIRYDNLFLTPFPYSMGIHQHPTGSQVFSGTQLHLHYFPPLLRSAEVRKFMVGYEMLAMVQRDITAEQSAQQLRELPEQHYLQEAHA